MSVMFTGGGPLDGQTLGEDQGGQPPSESDLFSSILDSARQLLSLGTVSEQNKLLLEKATTLIQQIKASEEKENEGAMSGKLSPGLMRRAYGG